MISSISKYIVAGPTPAVSISKKICRECDIISKYYAIFLVYSYLVLLFRNLITIFIIKSVEQQMNNRTNIPKISSQYIFGSQNNSSFIMRRKYKNFIIPRHSAAT